MNSRRPRSFYLTIALVFGVFFQLNAALFTWTGGGIPNDFSDPANWAVGGAATAVAPGPADDVEITGGSTAVILSMNVTYLSFEVRSGAMLTIAGTGVLNLGNDSGNNTEGAFDLSSSTGTVINNGAIIINNAAEDGLNSRGTFTNNGTITVCGFDDDGITIDDASSTGSTFTNNGTIDVKMTTGGEDDGIFVTDGSNFINNGPATISSIGCVGDVGLHVDTNNSPGATFTNNATGTLDIINTIDEAIFIDVGTTGNNNGAITTANSGICSGDGNHGLEVRGTFNNNAGATYKDTNSRGDAIRIENDGILNNAGTITLDITSGVTSDAIQNENEFNGLLGCVLEIGCPGVINEIEVNDSDTLDIGVCCVNFDINAPGSGGNDYDRFEIRNTEFDISTATAKLLFADHPAVGDCYKIIDGNSDGTGIRVGMFASVTTNLPGVAFDLDYSDPTEVEVCITEVCPPNLAAMATPMAVITESVCAVFGGAPAGGIVAAPATACPAGSTLEYSMNGGAFTTSLPTYDQTTAITVATRCVCDCDETVISVPAEMTTIPGICPACPVIGAVTAPAVVVSSQSTCNVIGGTPAGGVIAVPATACPTGSTVQYSVDGVAFSATLPTYNQTTAITVTTRCACDADAAVVSAMSMVTTIPGICPSCNPAIAAGTAPAAVVSSQSTCTVAGGTPAGGVIAVPATACPTGSTVQYSVDGVAFSATLPAYNQTTAVTVTTRCACDGDPAVVSATSMVTTIPGICPSCNPAIAAGTAPAAVISSESTCTVAGGTPAGGVITVPATACPAGSTIQYSVGSGAFSATLPVYNQTIPLTVTTRCACDEDAAVVSATSMVTTIPQACPQPPGCQPDCGAVFPANGN